MQWLHFVMWKFFYFHSTLSLTHFVRLFAHSLALNCCECVLRFFFFCWLSPILQAYSRNYAWYFYTYTPYSESNDTEGWGTINCAKSFFQQYRHFGENLFCCCCCCCFVMECVCRYMLCECLFAILYYSIGMSYNILYIIWAEWWEQVDSMINYGWWCILQLQNQTHGIQIKLSANEKQRENTSGSGMEWKEKDRGSDAYIE